MIIGDIEKVQHISNGVNSKSKKMLALISVMLVIAIALGVYVYIFNQKQHSEEIAYLKQLIQNYKTSNTYIQAYVDEHEFVAFLYNKNGEAFAQASSGSLAVYRNDDKYISFGSEVTIDYGVSPLRLIELALNLVENGKAELTRPDSNTVEKQLQFRTHLLRIKGKDNVKELYKQVNEKYAEKMVEDLYGDIYLKNSELQITIVENDKGLFGASCYMLLGGESYLSWYFDGYLQMYDWSLGNGWYSTDNADEEIWVTRINELVDDIEAKTQAFARDMGIDLNNTEEHTHIHGHDHDHDGDGIPDH